MIQRAQLSQILSHIRQLWTFVSKIILIISTTKFIVDMISNKQRSKRIKISFVAYG